MKWPRLNINFVIDDSDDRTSLLKNGLADIVALYPNQVALEFDSKLVKPDEYLLVCHPSWKDRSISEILGEERLFSFHENDPTSLNYLKTYNLLKFLKRPRMFVNENLALTKLLTSGVGCGILIKEIAAPLLKDKMLIALNEGKSMKEPMAFAWYPRQQMLPYFKDVLEALK
jgi:DNA-binding transcriptional LysR family regulator